MESSVSVLNTKEEGQALVKMQEMSEKAALTTGPLGLTAHASLAKAESLGRLQHVAAGPLAIADGDLKISEMCQEVVPALERTTAALTGAGSEGSPDGKRKTLARGSAVARSPKRRKLSDTASPLEVTAEEYHHKLLKAVLNNRGAKMSLGAKLRQSMNKHTEGVTALALVDSAVCASSLTRGLLYELPDKYETLVDRLATLCAGTATWTWQSHETLKVEAGPVCVSSPSVWPFTFADISDLGSVFG